MMRLKLVPSNTAIDFMKLRPSALVFSALLVLASLGIFLLSGLNLGIDLFELFIQLPYQKVRPQSDD